MTLSERERSASERERSAQSVARWFERRSYRHEQFSNLDALATRKCELDLTVSVVLPCREVAMTVGAIIDELHALNERAPLVDQILAIDASSADGTAEVARRHGAEVYLEDELLAQFGPALGKGDAMWRALSVARGELVAYLDSDTTNFRSHFVSGVLGPLLTESGVEFVKGTYARPFTVPGGLVLDDAGRVTELTAKPLFNLFYPQLAGFGQPLSGELVASRELLCSIPFLSGYAVETAMMIDLWRAIGLDAMAQVDLGTRHNRYQSLFALGAMSFAVARAVVMRLAQEGRIESPGDLDCYVHASAPEGGTRLEERRVEIVERPPIAEL